MKKSGLVLPSLFLIAGILGGHYFSPGTPPVQEVADQELPLSGPAAPILPENKAVPEGRPTEPVLADWQDFLQTLEQARLEDLPTLWTTLPLPKTDRPTGPGNSARHRLLIERWTELDPAGAMEFVRTLPPDEAHLLTTVVFQTWAQQDPEAAIAALRSETDPKMQGHGAAGFLLSFREEPGQLLRWAKRLTWVDATALDKSTFFAACPDPLLRSLLDTDAAAVREIAAHLPPWFRQHLETMSLFQQAVTDLPGVLASLKDRQFTKEEAGAMIDQLGSLAESAPASALAILEALRTASGGAALIGPFAPRGLAAGLVKYLAARDPQAAVSFMRQHLDGAAKLHISSTAYRELLVSNPAAALLIATAIPFLPNEIIPLPTFSDPKTALTFLPDAPPSWRRDVALQAALNHWRAESPEAALTWLKSLPEGEWRERAAAVLEDPEAHSNLVSLKLQGITARHETDPPEPLLEDIRRITGQAAQSDLSGTLDALSDWPSGPARQTALLAAAEIAANQNTAAALARIQRLPDPSTQADGIRGVMSVWGTHEPLAASAWLPTLTPGPMREAAVDSFAESISPLDPAASLTWAATLTDPAVRAARLETTYRNWAAVHPAEAAAALEEIPGLSPADLLQLRNPPSSSPR